MEKMYRSGTLQYESINDRINRLRKKSSLNKPKDRQNTFLIEEKNQLILQNIRKIDKQGNKHNYQSPSMKIDLSFFNIKNAISPRKCGISRRVVSKLANENIQKEKEDTEDSTKNKQRMPGKIYKNLKMRYQIQDSFSPLRLDSKYI